MSMHDRGEGKPGLYNAGQGQGRAKGRAKGTGPRAGPRAGPKAGPSARARVEKPRQSLRQDQEDKQRRGTYSVPLSLP